MGFREEESWTATGFGGVAAIGFKAESAWPRRPPLAPMAAAPPPPAGRRAPADRTSRTAAAPPPPRGELALPGRSPPGEPRSAASLVLAGGVAAVLGRGGADAGGGHGERRAGVGRARRSSVAADGARMREEGRENFVDENEGRVMMTGNEWWRKRPIF